MKILISPAKSLELNKEIPVKEYTRPLFLDTAVQVNKKLTRLTKQELMDLMSISEQLADLNYQRYQDFKEKHEPSNARQAVFTFDGDVYTGLDVYNLASEKYPKLQDELRILSGLYGILKPFDLIQPYRLEMGTKLGIENNKDLYELWKDKVTRSLNAELSTDDLLINLASNEYFKAVDKKKIKAQIITPVFKDYKNGKLKVISFYAKKARGAMVKFIVENNAKSLSDIQGFNLLGYAYSEEESKDNKQPTFVR
ncbi:MAG: peroxide stress protein YaaA [Flavobacteriaceae bacterium]|nr:peroxide stress protein YaaA [Flavobacteriaceae bacterium]